VANVKFSEWLRYEAPAGGRIRRGVGAAHLVSIRHSVVRGPVLLDPNQSLWALGSASLLARSAVPGSQNIGGKRDKKAAVTSFPMTHQRLDRDRLQSNLNSLSTQHPFFISSLLFPKIRSHHGLQASSRL